MVESKHAKLRRVITESLRVQRDGDPIDYIDVGTSLQDACARQNHAIFARRGCGKTLLLHYSGKNLPDGLVAIYLNCEDFKRHSFPNVLIEILLALFGEIRSNLPGWFGKKRKSRELIEQIEGKLRSLRQADDRHEEVRTKHSAGTEKNASSAVKVKAGGAVEGQIGSAGKASYHKEEERAYSIQRSKLAELDQWLPSLKGQIREFFVLSNSVKGIFLQIDDLYHLKRKDQAFVVDYIHRLCKDVPLYFKIATLRHASTLYLDGEGQPIGAQERHDYQPINVDYTFNDFNKTLKQNREILYKFGEKAGMTAGEIDELFKGEGLARLVMAGGGVPRDVLSLFLEVLTHVGDGKIGKDEVRILSKENFERRIEELKQDSQGDEQDDLIKGIYIIREFCLTKKTNLFLVSEKMLQQNDQWRALINRLLDYRIIHSCANAITHKSQEGTYQAYAIDIGCYAHLRKLEGKFTEIDVSSSSAKEKMRSAAIIEEGTLASLFQNAPEDAEAKLLEELDDAEVAAK